MSIITSKPEQQLFKTHPLKVNNQNEYSTKQRVLQQNNMGHSNSFHLNFYRWVEKQGRWNKNMIKTENPGNIEFLSMWVEWGPRYVNKIDKNKS